MAGVWTNNWRAFRNIMLMGAHHNGFSTLTNIQGNVISDIFNVQVGATSPMGIYGLEQASTGASNSIKVGTGSTAAAATDYQLASPESVSYLSVLAGEPTYDSNTGIMTRGITLSIQNQSSGSVTISEWGIYGTVRSVAYYSTQYGAFLLYREVLSTPITLTQFQAATLTLTLSLTLTDPL